MCKNPLTHSALRFRCPSCDREYPIVKGIPDFFVAESGHDFGTDPNTIWLDPEIVQARDTYYRLCARELPGMAYCVSEMARRTAKRCRVLEVGAGTGHFSRWLAEVSAPGTAIYAFDFSWPMLEVAERNIGDWPSVTLFRANAREGLPFGSEAFDMVYIRLAPLGPRGVSNMEAAFEQLKPGGWYFWAGWEPEALDTPPIKWALQHGYERAEYHEWRYRRVQSELEYAVWQIEHQRLLAMMEKRSPGAGEDKSIPVEPNPGPAGGYIRMTHENVLIAQKPGPTPVGNG
jgi:SAM-dependent methyltransferase